MPGTNSTRGWAVAWLAAVAGVAAAAQAGPASSLPANAPTTASQVAPLTASPAQTGAGSRARRAEVRYDGGLISINASNSSLNQILREIARQTGMKITGGVRDERVFGHYGPATPDVILETLIDSNQTNMLLRHTDVDAPAELILTPRAGGPSPPNPNAAGFDDDDRAQQEPVQPTVLPSQTTQPSTVNQQGDRGQGTTTPNPGSVPPSIPQPANNVLGDPNNTTPSASTLPVTNSIPVDSVSSPSTARPANQGIVDGTNPVPGVTVPSAPDTTDSATTPNGAKTPEDIYQQLMKLRQQQTAPK